MGKNQAGWSSRGWLSWAPLPTRREGGGREGTLGSRKLLEKQDRSGGQPSREGLRDKPPTAIPSRRLVPTPSLCQKPTRSKSKGARGWRI